MHKPSHLLRRSDASIRYRLLSIIAIALFSFAALPDFAAEAAAVSLFETDQELYAQLASGHKILEPRDYVTPERPTVYLTFDDGPSKLTPQVLDILKEEDVKATFFELGGEAESHPDIVQRVVNEGHALGNHTYDHVYSKLYGSFDEFWRQVQATDDVFAGLVGFRPRLLRAPGGTATNFDAYYFYYLDQAGYTVFDWNVDSGDSKRASVPAKEILNTVKMGPFTHEVTVLMHDGSGHASTVKALPDIIRVFKEKGYAFRTLSEKVRPEQFGIAKLKWSRAMPQSKFGRLAAEVRTAGERRLAEAQPDGSGGDVRTAAAVPPPPDNDVPLLLKLSAGDTVLPAGGYELQQGALRVPLRLLAQRLGGEVGWNEQTRTATVRYGLRELKYELNTHTLRTYTLGRPQHVYPYADMKLTDGSIFVPLRSTAALLGEGIGDWSMQRDGRYVTILQPFGPASPFSTLFSYL